MPHKALSGYGAILGTGGVLPSKERLAAFLYLTEGLAFPNRMKPMEFEDLGKCIGLLMSNGSLLIILYYIMNWRPVGC